jgi:hypothetical protein
VAKILGDLRNCCRSSVRSRATDCCEGGSQNVTAAAEKIQLQRLRVEGDSVPRWSRWSQMVEESRLEALNAVEFYNRPMSRRPLEAFLVHMHIAWLYLLQAEFLRAGISYYYRDPNHPSRYLKSDGERKSWDLERCVRERWTATNDPVRKNVEFTIRLRNRIEHRYQAGLMVVATGFTQALIINYEEEIVSQFGELCSIASEVHLPISLSTFSRDGLARLIAAQQALPGRLRDWIVDYRSGMDDEVLNDRRFEFRVEIIQKRAPAHEADLAVSFVREEELTQEQREAYEALERSGRIILREKERAVSGLGLYKPKYLASLVEDEIPFKFGASSELPQAWKKLNVRPSSSARGSTRRRTDERYCVYDEPHDDYMYTRAFAEMLIRRCGTSTGFRELIGREPRPKSEATPTI